MAVLAVCALVLAGCGAAGGDATSSTTAGQVAAAGQVDAPTADRHGPLPDGGASSCVEHYSAATIAGRAFAFDGVVVDIGRSVSDRGDDGDLGLPGVTFEVREWFAGGRAETVTVDLQPARAPEESVPAYGLGSRLLVSGEPRWGGKPLAAPIAWGCGFSRYYDAETATVWREALGR